MADSTWREICEISSFELPFLASILFTATDFFSNFNSTQRSIKFLHSTCFSSGTINVTSLDSLAKRDLMVDSTLRLPLVVVRFSVTMATEHAWLSLRAALARASGISSVGVIFSCLLCFSSCRISSNALSEINEQNTGFSDMKTALVCMDSSHLGTFTLLNSSLFRSVMKLQAISLWLTLIAKGNP